MKAPFRFFAAVLILCCLLVSCVPAEPPSVEASAPAPSTTVPSTSSETTSTSSPQTTPPTTTVPAETVPSGAPITASHAYIYRSSDQRFLFLRGSLEEKIYPASITKLLTAYVVLMHLTPEQEITVGTAIGTLPPDSSHASLKVGDVLTVEQLLYGMLLPSGGDAARMLAAQTGRILAGSEILSDTQAIDRFMEEVNSQAAALGMTGSHFVTPDGFHDPEHYTTMQDLLLLTKLTLDTPLLRSIVSTVQYSAALPDRTLTWRNTNMLLNPSSPYSQFYREGTIGLKTGYTHTAGRCLLAAFDLDGETVFAGVFGCPDPSMNFIAQFESICYLYDTYLAPQ